MKTLNIILSTALVALTFSSFAQNKYQGIVTGIDGPIEGVKILCQETGTKLVTDSKGEFTIDSKFEELHLQSTYKKMASSTVATPNQKPIVINLIPSDRKLYKILTERNEIRLCDIYIDYYPKGEFIEMVKQTKEKLFFIEAYNIAASQFSDTALRNYLKIYPTGTYKEKAMDAIEIAAWQKAKYENTAGSYQEYLNQYPTGKAANLAKEKLTGLK